MEEKVPLLLSIKQNLPLILLGIFGIYMVFKNLFSKNRSSNNHDIDTMIKQSTIHMNAKSAKSGTTAPLTLRKEIAQLKDPRLVEFTRALEWGDKLDLHSLVMPYALEKGRLDSHLKRILGLPASKSVSTYSQLLTYFEQEINRYYLDNPLESFPKDDILTAYKLFGLQPNAKKDMIKKRYHKLSLHFHPDKIQKRKGSLQTKNIQTNYLQIQNAYEILMKSKEK